MKLILTPLEKALKQLEKGLWYLTSNESQKDSELREQFRAAVIHAFEFSFELSWKLLKRYLENYSLEKVDGFTTKQLFRVGFEQGLIRDPNAWFDYLEKRNPTTHTYDGAVAERVYEGAKGFLRDAQDLLQKLKSKTA
ncbi:MAG: nucleotidyltransferase substrate binding protein [Deltaproteobacteria bacterium]|nr:nucleotidyltransferase substrate binding protein [Deltaproteobacteria bacterium]